MEWVRQGMFKGGRLAVGRVKKFVGGEGFALTLIGGFVIIRIPFCVLSGDKKE